MFEYDILAEDPVTHARAGVFHTPHGDVPTPIFMPVGTKATVKGLLPPTLHDLGTKILLANTYHLSGRPSWVHGVGWPNPYRFGRLPGVQPRRAFQVVG